MGIYQWDTTASDNDDAADDINWAEGQNPSTVNDSARQMMADVAEFLLDLACSNTTSNTGNAYTLTTNGSIPALADGLIVGFKANAANTGAATLAVDGLAAKAIRHTDDTAVQTGDILADAHYLVTYDSAANSAAGAWIMLNPSRGGFVRSSGNETIAGVKTFSSDIQATGLDLTASSASIARDVDDDTLSIYGGTTSNGGSIQLNGGSFVARPDAILIDADQVLFRGVGGSGTPDVTIQGDGNTTFAIASSGGDARINLNGAAGEQKAITIRSGGSQRWAFESYGAETGSDAGATLQITAWNDSETLIGIAQDFRRSDGRVRFPLGYSVTTASAANVHWAAGGDLLRSTSSKKYKHSVETLDDKHRDLALKLRPVWYRSKCEEDNEAWSYYGFIAEEVAELDPRLVHWKTKETIVEDGEAKTVNVTPEPEGVMYERIVPHLVALVQDQNKRLKDLEGRVAYQAHMLAKAGVRI